MLNNRKIIKTKKDFISVTFNFISNFFYYYHYWNFLCIIMNIIWKFALSLNILNLNHFFYI